VGVSPNQRRSQTLLTVITAPAGYGKSTLLSEWLQQMGDLDVGWLSLDPEDNDLQQFWRYVVAALQTSVPELGRQALMLLQELPPPGSTMSSLRS
jgi:ATP/maltotriose-dependent transcriptional regulator MalT